ncbi:Fic family protein [Treponema zioleckii]|uniref:Fic family protein n=1 Tax=Treponema zioleckii TaxID=331680 RepID=UPI00168ABC58|nr:Fic family protein [Treponema zioleckii]
MEKNPYEIDFEEYIRHTDASKKDKTFAWSTAIGLQQVDGLKPSSYLYETAKKNIEGELSFDEAKNLIDSYYESRTARNQDDERTEEADKVSSRIAQILSEPSFNFSPSHLIAIHKRLFEGIFKFAGKIRDYDITKKEWVLNGDTVMYGASFELKAALDYDFEMERNFKYKGLSTDEIIKHITFFVSRLWQIHAFGEGNTRTTAVFTIKYLRSMGYKVYNDIFAQNSWYFRNALVRANYKNIKAGIEENPVYLERFFRNLILGKNNELKNRYTHVDYDEYIKKFGENDKSSEKNQSINDTAKITQKITVKITVNQQKIIDVIKENPFITQEELSSIVGIARLNINKNMKKLQEQGIIKRVGADKNGHWEVIE